MATGKHYVNEVGTPVVVDCGSAITGATSLALKVKKPDGTLVSWTPTIYETNYLKYIVQSGDFNLSGTYYLQASLTLGGWSGLGETASFQISAVYD